MMQVYRWGTDVFCVANDLLNLLVEKIPECQSICKQSLCKSPVFSVFLAVRLILWTKSLSHNMLQTDSHPNYLRVCGSSSAAKFQHLGRFLICCLSLHPVLLLFRLFVILFAERKDCLIMVLCWSILIPDIITVSHKTILKIPYGSWEFQPKSCLIMAHFTASLMHPAFTGL